MELIEEEKGNPNRSETQNQKEKVKTLGEKIVEGRKEKHLSQEKFAEKMGCTRQMVSRWELNQSVPRTPTMKKISSVLNIPIEELIGENKNSPKNQNGTPVAKSFNYKLVIKYILITAVILVALYLLYSGYKFLVLNGISSKVAQYKDLDNYHFKVESYVNNNLNEIVEIWYKDGFYKISNTVVADNISDTTIKYLDLNEGCRYLVNEEQKTYTKYKLLNADNYSNGEYMYTLFPLIIQEDWAKIKKNIWTNNLILSYYKNGYLVLKVNDEKIKFNKDNYLPNTHTVVMKANNTVQENDDLYKIELDVVTYDDVKISSEYKIVN